MTPALYPNHKWASLKLYNVVALNAITESEYTINRLEVAQALADLLQINRRAPKAWLRGDFKKYPLSLENFRKFVRAYRGKPGLETPKEITALAIDLYGMEYQKALDLLDPQDRRILPVPKVKVQDKEKDLAQELLDLIETRPREEVNLALVKLMARVVEQAPSQMFPGKEFE